MIDYTSLKSDAISIKSKVDFLTSLCSSLQKDIDKSTELLKQLSAQYDLQLDVYDAFKDLVSQISAKQLNKIKELVSFALKTIFYDKQYSFDIIITDKRSVKNCDLYLIETLSDGSVLKSSVPSSVGGGIISVIGVILQIYFILLSHKARILFVDEGFTQISVQYVDTFLDFMEQLCETKDFTLVLITHDDRFIREGYNHYVVQDGGLL